MYQSMIFGVDLLSIFHFYLWIECLVKIDSKKIQNGGLKLMLDILCDGKLLKSQDGNLFLDVWRRGGLALDPS